MMKRKILLPLMMAATTIYAQPTIEVGGHTVMQQSDFGLRTNMRAWDASARLVSTSKPVKINEDYSMVYGKRHHCTNQGVETTYTLLNAQGDTLQVVMRHYRDGYAFRYVVRGVKPGERVQSEGTQYHVPNTANRWMQQYNGPGYEHFFPLCPGGVSPEGERITRWGYPALVEVSDGQFMLITESDVLRDNCGSILNNTTENRSTYTVSLFGEEPMKAGKDGTWRSPWRVVMAGSLADVVESTLVTDVATPCQYLDTSWIEPGVSSWIYWAYNHGSQEYNILKEYVDLAAEMGWPYTLVDAEWDVMRGGSIEDIVRYSTAHGVKPMIWYNSTTNWTGKWAPTPQGRLNEPDDRENEFRRISAWGVKGVKIDFFSEDRTETMNYYLDLIECASRYKMLVNFHGGTIPRGWQRTYPNFISAESVYGAEWYNNNGRLTPKAACHNATLPFTRNVIGPMDYTPGTFTDSQNPHITTHGHELALTVLFESGIQHMPDRPSAYRELPEQVRQVLSGLTMSWDDTRLLGGYPGQSVIMARRAGTRWYIAGINGQDQEQTLTFSLKRLGKVAKSGTLFADGDTQTTFNISEVSPAGTMSVPCKARGGFLLVI